MYMRCREILTSIETGPLALGLVRAANVVGTGVLAFGFVVTGLDTVGFAVTGAWVVTDAGGGVGAAVATGAEVATGALVAGTVVTGAAVAGGFVVAGAVAGGDVVAGALEGIVGKTSEGAGVSWALAISMVPAITEALMISTPNSDLRTRMDLVGTGRGEVFTS
jgi:hypothetical protein